MMDKYTKVILTVIAILLAGNMWFMYQAADAIKGIERWGVSVNDIDVLSHALYGVRDELDELNDR